MPEEEQERVLWNNNEVAVLVIRSGWGGIEIAVYEIEGFFNQEGYEASPNNYRDIDDAQRANNIGLGPIEVPEPTYEERPLFSKSEFKEWIGKIHENMIFDLKSRRWFYQAIPVPAGVEFEISDSGSHVHLKVMISLSRYFVFDSSIYQVSYRKRWKDIRSDIKAKIPPEIFEEADKIQGEFDKAEKARQQTAGKQNAEQEKKRLEERIARGELKKI